MKQHYFLSFTVLLSLFTSITLFAQNGVTVAGTGRVGSADNQLNSASGIAKDADGNLYIADRYNSRIMKYAPGATSGVQITGFYSSPVDVFIDKAGYLYATDDQGAEILKFAPGTVSSPQVIIKSTPAFSFLTQGGLFVDQTGNVYFIDTRNKRLLKYAPGASMPSMILNVGKSLHDVYLDASGNIYLSEDADNAVVKFAPGDTIGVIVAGGNGRGFGTNQLANPFGIFVDALGNLYIADGRNSRVQKWAPGAREGVTVAGGNGAGSALNQLTAPEGLLIDNLGYLYVSDYDGARVLRFDPTGLKYKYYEGAWSSLPDFNSLTPVKTGTSRNADISFRTPGRDDNFAFVWEGYIKIPAAGSYTFETVSDDGSRLYFNSLYNPLATALVNNDGLHAPTSATGTIYIPSAGTYPISITYFEKDGGQQMQAYWTGPGITRQLIPDEAFSATPPTTVPPPSPASLSYKYYEGGFSVLPDFSTLTPVKTGRSANFDIGIRTPGVNDSFAIVWDGFINIPMAGDYTFETISDDGSKFYFNGATVVDNDGTHPAKSVTGIVNVPIAGRYPIKVAYFEAYGDQSFQVLWSGPGFSRQQIPDPAFADTTATLPTVGLNYKYYEGNFDLLPDFNALTPLRSGIGNAGDLSVKNPGTDIHFALIWQGYINLPAAGTYTLETVSDDGSKIYFNNPYDVNAASLVNNDGLHASIPATGTVTVTAAGSYPIAITYFQKESGYSMQLFWSGPGIARQLIPDSVFTTTAIPVTPPSFKSGLGYKYYEGIFNTLPDFNTQTPAKTGSSSNIDISVRPAGRDYQYLFMWQGYISIPVAGTYTFETISDDGSKLYFNQTYNANATPVVNNDGIHPATSASGTVNVPAAGWYPIVVTFLQNIGSAQITAYWSGPGFNRQQIPNGVLAETLGPVSTSIINLNNLSAENPTTLQPVTRFYPNPFRESFNIDFFNSAAANDIEITIYNLNGVLMYRKNGGKALAGNTTINVNLGSTSLLPGMYVARLQVNGIPATVVKILKK